MNVCRFLILLFLIAGVSTFAAQPAKEQKTSKSKDQELKSELSKTPPPELPAKAAQAVAKEKGENKEKTIGTIMVSVAENRASSLPPVVASIAATAPNLAAKAAAEAAKASPSQAVAIAVVAAQAAPSFAGQIATAVTAQVPAAAPQIQSSFAQTKSEADFNGKPPPKSPPPNRPIDPPGSVNGNRPPVPPGHIRDPKPGRDNRNNYGQP